MFMEQFDEWAKADPDGVVKEWLASKVYTNTELMSELDPMSVMLAEHTLRQQHEAAATKKAVRSQHATS